MHDLAEVLIRQGRAERRHPRPTDRRAAVLDEVEEVLVRTCVDRRGVAQLTGPDQEERRAPRACSIRPVTRRAETEIEARSFRCAGRRPDRKSTRLNSSHRCISYAVFCLK